MDGKQIILQRLRNKKDIKKYRFLEGEMWHEVFDLNSKK